MNRRRRVRVAVIIGVVGIALAACGVPAQRDAQTIDRADVPFGLLETTDASTTTTVPTTPSVALAFTRAGSRVFVDRKVTDDRQGAEAALRQLLAGPSDVEAGDGIRTGGTAGVDQCHRRSRSRGRDGIPG